MATVVRTVLPSPLVVGSVSEARVEAIAPTFPEYVFWDWGPKLNTSGYLPEEHAQIASLKMGVWPAERLATVAGATQIGKVRLVNPALRVMAIWSVQVVGANPPDASRPLSVDLYNLLTTYRAKHVDDAPIVSWPAPPDPVIDYWHTVLPASGGYLYNRALLEAVTQLVVSRLAEFLPAGVNGINFDYFNPHGPFVWPTELVAHGEADLDDDGVGIGSDPVEGAAWDAWLEALPVRMRELMGSDPLIVPNGRAALPPNDANTGNATIAAATHGNIWEGFPALPWYNPRKSIELLHAAISTAWNRNYWGRQVHLLGMANNAQQIHRDCARVCSAIFQVPYFRYTAADGSPFYTDEELTWSAYPVAGPIVYTADIGGGVGEWSRQFGSGLARVRAAARSGDGPSQGGGIVSAEWIPA